MRFTIVGQTVVDLVDDQLPLALADEIGNGIELLVAQHRSGRVGRRRQQCSRRTYVPVRFEVCRGRLKVAFRAHGNADREAFKAAYEVTVARIARVGEQPFAARFDQTGQSQQEGAGGSGGDGNACGGDAQAVTCLVEVGDGAAQFGQAKRRRVKDAAVLDAGSGGGDDWFGCREVGFTDFHVDDVATVGCQRPGTSHQLHDVEGGNVREAAGGKHGHDLAMTDWTKPAV